MARDLLQLDEATERLRPLGRRSLGVRTIALGRIVGTDSRGSDFDRRFTPRRRDVGERVHALERAFPDGVYPPIVVYQLGDAYFVVDGHHRVAAARWRGMTTIDADVTELRARWHLHADADRGELVHAEQERLFMAESGLGEACPDSSCFRFSHAVGYVQLLEAIQVHGYRLMLGQHRTLSREEVALDWYGRVYLPTLETIHEERLAAVCPQVTDSDRFLWVYERRRELALEHSPQGLGDAARRAARELAQRQRGVRRLLRWRSG
jgi:hypothetical protein